MMATYLEIFLGFLIVHGMFYEGQIILNMKGINVVKSAYDFAIIVGF